MTNVDGPFYTEKDRISLRRDRILSVRTVYFPGSYTFKNSILYHRPLKISVHFRPSSPKYDWLPWDGRKFRIRSSASEEACLRQFPTKKNSRIFHSHVFSIRKMTLTQIPICGFFVHNFQIGVKQTRDSTIELILFFFRFPRHLWLSNYTGSELL